MLIFPVWHLWKIGGQKFYCAIYNAKTRFLVGMWEFWLKYLILVLKKFPLNSHCSHWIVKILFSSWFLNVKYCVNLVGIVGICLKSNWYWLKMAVFCPKKAGKFPLNSHWWDFCWQLAAGWCPVFACGLWFLIAWFSQFHCVECEILCDLRNFIVLVRNKRQPFSGCLKGVLCVSGNDFGRLFLGCLP